MKKHVTDIIADFGEIGLDAITENEVIREIPILGTAVSLARAGASIRDKLFLTKIKRFIDHISETTPEQRNKLVEESRKDESRRARVGEAVFTTLEQSDSVAKVDYVSSAFEAFLNNDISDSDLRMMCFAIRLTFIDDLVDFVESPTQPTMALLKYLEAFGLSRSIFARGTRDKEADIEYEISDAGVKLRSAWHKYKKT